ncbi:similar to Naumovozyma dairenensis NDAI_0E01230 hypothetical protein [Maudiozyma saulgeensis]|uniref:Uncharacterized protein n=1 Tax=Maudiozyma saulgeensis TaxID=1789683 RepID=A0A1X7R930_9SACH|nr:similar to Naumovozyma dairenensis NDAI_0E01230 hypothetical protein [Kazachstania saulgeensis]
MKFNGILHKYNEHQVAFEYEPAGLPKALIMIGGMTDGLTTVPYLANLPHVLEPLGYSVVQIQMKSSFIGWGTSSVKEDVAQVKQLIDYLKSEEGGNKKEIVIMGHSTGSQDVMQSLLTISDSIKAGILQASCSDRECFTLYASKEIRDDLNSRARKLLDESKGEEMLPREYMAYTNDTPVTAYRWCSVMLPNGDDDFFSTDLSDDSLKRTFGKINKPFLVAYSEKDEFIPKEIDKPAVLKRWESISNPKFWSKNSGIVPGASHGVKQPASQKFLYEKISAFFEEFNL